MLEVLKLLIASRNAEIHEVDFPAELGPSYVHASQSAIDEAVDRFLGIEASGGPRGSLDKAESSGRKKGKKKSKAKRKKPKLKAKPPGSDGLVPALEAGEAEADVVARKVSAGFPVFYPSRLPSGAAYEESNPFLHIQDPRVYHFKDTDGNRHGAYRMVLTLDLPDGTHYFGVQGIQGWSDPPLLNAPSVKQTIRGREYEIFFDGDRVRLVAWHRGDNTYWVANSLLRVLTSDQMIGIARSARVKIPNKKPRKRRAAL
jgi:hypothetical protein